MLHGRNPARGAARAGLLSLSLLALGAGCGDDAVPSDPTKFVGTWMVTAGQIMPSCMGLPLGPTSLVGETITVSPGTDSALIILVRSCTLKFDIAGNTATAKAGQSCQMMVTAPVLGQIALNLGVDSSSFTVVEKTATLSQSGTGTLSVAIPVLPAGTSCPYQLTASATKNP
jgi:hypothetical protein